MRYLYCPFIRHFRQRNGARSHPTVILVERASATGREKLAVDEWDQVWDHLSRGTDPLSGALDADLDGGRRAARERHRATFDDVVDGVWLHYEHRRLRVTTCLRTHPRDQRQQHTYTQNKAVL